MSYVEFLNLGSVEFEAKRVKVVLSICRIKLPPTHYMPLAPSLELGQLKMSPDTAQCPLGGKLAPG